MNAIKVIFGITVGIYAVHLSGQSFREPLDADTSTGERDFSHGRDVIYDVQRNVNNFRDLNISKKVERASSDQAILNNWIAMNRAKALADHANYKMNLAQKSEKKQLSRYYESEDRITDQEAILADKWRKSKTGILDGRDWYDLSEGERHIYRLRYIKFQNPSLKLASDNLSSSDTRLKISQKEYEYAWNIRNLGNARSGSWDTLNFETKNKFRKYYHGYKLAKLSPRPKISEEEFAVAWEIAQIGNRDFVSWDEMNDPNVKDSFRKHYQEMKNKTGIEIPTHRLNQENDEEPIIAFASSVHKGGR
jgi:hypothetical protein